MSACDPALTYLRRKGSDVPPLASEVQSLPPLAPMGNSDLLSFAMLMHAGVRDPFYWAAAATPLISSFLARASFSQAKRRSHYTAHHTSIQRWWLKHYSRRRDKLIDYRRQCLQSTRSLPVHVRCVCVCVFLLAGWRTRAAHTHHAKPLLFCQLRWTRLCSSVCGPFRVVLCARLSFPFKLFTFYSTLLQNLTGSSTQSSPIQIKVSFEFDNESYILTNF
jgi:hypothetical protein